MNRGDVFHFFMLLKRLREAINTAGETTVQAIAENTKATEHAAEQAPSPPPSRITVDVQIPREETDRYYTEQQSGQRLQWATFWATVATFIAVAAYAVITYLQWQTMNNTYCEIKKQTAFSETSSKGATAAAKTAQDALSLARENFRQDERPFVTMGPAGSQGNIQLLNTGEHTGHVMVTMALANYGKSATIEGERDARLAIGPDAARRIRMRQPTDTRERIIPPGDKPAIYAYSDEIVSLTTFNEIMSGTTLMLIYGHVKYSDLLSEPRPTYVTEFCTAMLINNQRAEEADRYCKGHTYIK